MSLTRFKALISLAILAVYLCFSYTYNLVESPLRGAANAQQLNDSTYSYAWSRFFSNDGLTTIVFWFVVIVLAIIWLSNILNLVKRLIK